MTNGIAIIGAGMAGLVAARRLAQGGVAATLFEKSHDVGGRMATRQVQGLAFDHGAQYFTAKGPGFQALVEQLRISGDIAPWFNRAYVGSPGMNAPARAMAAHFRVVAGCRIERLERRACGWVLHDGNGREHGSYRAVILAIPLPQAIPLAQSAGLELPGTAEVAYAPCWALMLGFELPTMLEDRLTPSSDRLANAGIASGTIADDTIADDMIAWIARNTSKPGRMQSGDQIVIHATPAWSRMHLEDEPADIAERMLARFRALTGLVATPAFIAAHRWRYALVEQAMDAPCLWDPQTRLGACGDWCMGPRVEAAFDSGEAVAQAVLASPPEADA